MSIILKTFPGVQKNIILKNFTSFLIGGKARYFFVAKTKENLISIIKKAEKEKIPFYILGGGTNLLISDKGFNGLVIKILFSELQTKGSKLFAEAGVNLGKLANITVQKELSGLEWLAGIPGTIGGAIYGNAGAFGKSMKDVVESVEVLDTKEFRTESRRGGMKMRAEPSSPFKNYVLKDCKFDYRESIFKKKKNFIIVSAKLKLKKGRKSEIKKKIKEYLEYKKATQPLNFPSAGSVFKNNKKFFAAELIEKCGLKGKTVSGVKISEKHANFIVNLGDARAKDVKKLINLAKREVKKRFGVKLEEEIQYLGF